MRNIALLGKRLYLKVNEYISYLGKEVTAQKKQLACNHRSFVQCLVLAHWSLIVTLSLCMHPPRLWPNTKVVWATVRAKGERCRMITEKVGIFYVDHLSVRSARMWAWIIAETSGGNLGVEHQICCRM